MGFLQYHQRIGPNLISTCPKIFSSSKSNILSFHAISSALFESGWSADEIAESGIIFATTTSQIDCWEHVLPYFKTSTNPTDLSNAVAQQSLGSPLIHFKNHFKILGPCTTIASSCSASLQAIGTAYLWIKSKSVKRCLVFSSEINSTLTSVGFNSLRLISKTISKPFDLHRQGINLGEASAALCLEESSKTRSHFWGSVSGAGFSLDAYHPTSPHHEGLGSQQAMRMALTSAKLLPAEIDWIYSHGTGSPANDESEAKAISAVFSDNSPPVSSTKSLHGHTLGSSGALESVLGLMAMKEEFLLPTFNYETPDPKISLQINTSVKKKKLTHFLKNSLGFGGVNCSIIYSKEKPQ